ncbi:MAG: hypothetical protein GX330_03555, partial [Bacteroidales bacterium]|nr:hypothetical protein [Bacteroidales bacterium]
MKKIFVLLSVIWFTQIAVSQQVSFKEAQTVAQNFFSKQHKSLVNCVYVSKNKNDTLFYIFNATDGFVVIAADKRSVPVLAFSDKGSFDKQEIIAPVRMWL